MEHATDRQRAMATWHQSALWSDMPWIDLLSFLGMCLVSTAVYGLACWVGRLF